MINLDTFCLLRNRESYGQCRDHGERLGKMKHDISLKDDVHGHSTSQGHALTYSLGTKMALARSDLGREKIIDGVDDCAPRSREVQQVICQPA